MEKENSEINQLPFKVYRRSRSLKLVVLEARCRTRKMAKVVMENILVNSSQGSSAYIIECDHPVII